MMRLHPVMCSFRIDGGYNARVKKEGEGNEARETSLEGHGNGKIHQGRNEWQRVEGNERELKSQQQRNEYVCWMKKKKKQIEATDKPLLVYIPFRKA
jgi:hypothetical protein